MAGLLDARCKIPLHESNLMNVGSELDAKHRAQAARGEPAWQSFDKNTPGLHIWRIEKFHVNAWPRDQYGCFLDGDSYIVLSIIKQRDGTMHYDIHFWLGTYTTQDEAGTAAYKTVELDDYMNGVPIQYREVQGHESAAFLSLFPNSSLRIYNGGIESGFSHVQTNVAAERKPALYHVSGPTMTTVRVIQIPKLAVNQLSEEDAFVLDPGSKASQLFVFQGLTSSPGERNKAGTFAQELKDEIGLRYINDVVVVRSDDSDGIPSLFWKTLGGKRSIPALNADSTLRTQGKVTDVKLFEVSDVSGRLKFTLKCKNAKELCGFRLDNDECYVLMESPVRVTVWIGTGSTDAEKLNAMAHAHAAAVESGNPAMQLVRLVKGYETSEFLSFFKA